MLSYCLKNSCSLVYPYFPYKSTNKVPNRIEVKLARMRQLFNTMDPSPFYEKDLERNAQVYIESYAAEFPVDEPVVLVVHLADLDEESANRDAARETIESAVHHHFQQMLRSNAQAFSDLMLDGRRFLLIGLAFLFCCLATVEALNRISEARTEIIVFRESLIIAGWVGMWRPMEIYLYDWWPLRRRSVMLEKLSQMDVIVQPATIALTCIEPPPPASPPPEAGPGSASGSGSEALAPRSGGVATTAAV